MFQKEIRAVGDAVPLDEFRLVVSASERAQLGADEINQRITSLGGQPIPIFKMGQELPDGNLIVIAPCPTKATFLIAVFQRCYIVDFPTLAALSESTKSLCSRKSNIGGTYAT